jgi:hypothetical protein
MNSQLRQDLFCCLYGNDSGGRNAGAQSVLERLFFVGYSDRSGLHRSSFRGPEKCHILVIANFDALARWQQDFEWDLRQ